MYVFVGAIAGVLAGLLGIGGGLVLVPVFAALMPRQGVPDEVLMHTAIGTSMACIVMTAISSIRSHHQAGAVIWPVFKWLAVGLIAGAVIGVMVADLLPSDTLKRIFGVLAVLLGLKFLFRPGHSEQRPIQLPQFVLSIAGVIVGALSSIMGIGGGALNVPLLNAFGLSMRQAVGTAAAGGLPIALAGMLGYMVTGLEVSNMPTGAVGYVYLPAAAAIVVASVLTAPIGAKLAHTLPTVVLKRVFGVLLVVIGSKMAFF